MGRAREIKFWAGFLASTPNDFRRGGADVDEDAGGYDVTVRGHVSERHVSSGVLNDFQGEFVARLDGAEELLAALACLIDIGD